jgi:hypothetical protein
MLVAFTSVVGLNCTTPAASLLRTPPSRPRASARSCTPRGGCRRSTMPAGPAPHFSIVGGGVPSIPSSPPAGIGGGRNV